jgi:hypothetical protein
MAGRWKKVLRPAAWRSGLVSAAGAAAVAGLVAARFGEKIFFRADGISFLMIARNLSGHGLGAGDDAYRYGRMLYPLAGLVLAGGHKAWLLWTLPLVNCLAFGATVAFSVELVARQRRPVSHGLAILAVPALWLCLAVAWSECLLIALLLAFVVCHQQRRHTAAAVCLALAVLTKESAALLLLPLAFDALRKRDWKALAGHTLTALPAGAWWTWTRIHLGAWPFLAATPSRTLAIAPPFVGMVELIRLDGATPFNLAEITVVLATAGAAVGLWWRRRDAIVPAAAAVTAAFALCFGFHVLHFAGDTLRVLSPALALTLAAAAAEDPSVASDRWTRTSIPSP